MPTLQRCVPAPLSCAPTERYDLLRQRCVPDIPEPVAPSFAERRCQDAQADLSDALVELAVKEAELSQCQSPDPPLIGCRFIEGDVDSALRRVESARSSVTIWCR